MPLAAPRHSPLQLWPPVQGPPTRFSLRSSLMCCAFLGLLLCLLDHYSPTSDPRHLFGPLKVLRRFPLVRLTAFRSDAPPRDDRRPRRGSSGHDADVTAALADITVKGRNTEEEEEAPRRPREQEWRTHSGRGTDSGPGRGRAPFRSAGDAPRQSQRPDRSDSGYRGRGTDDRDDSSRRPRGDERRSWGGRGSDSGPGRGRAPFRSGGDAPRQSQRPDRRADSGYRGRGNDDWDDDGRRPRGYERRSWGGRGSEGATTWRRDGLDSDSRFTGSKVSFQSQPLLKELQAVEPTREAVFQVLNATQPPLTAATGRRLLIDAVAARPEALLPILDFLEERGIERGDGWYVSLITQLGTSNRLDLAEPLLDHATASKLGQPGERFYCALITTCSHGRRPAFAIRFYKRMLAAGVRPDVLVYTAVMRAYGRNDDWQAAFRVWEQMLESDVEPDVIACNTILDALARGGQFKTAQRVLAFMEQQALTPDSFTFSSLLTAAQRAGTLADVEAILAHMQELNVAPGEFAYATLIKAYGDAAQPDKAVAAFEAATRAKVPLTVVVYNSLISALQRHGDAPRALAAFNDMTRAGLQPTKLTYGPLIAACLMAGNIAKAESLYEDMVRAGIQPDFAIEGGRIIPLVSDTNATKSSRRTPWRPWPMGREGHSGPIRGTSSTPTRQRPTEGHQEPTPVPVAP